MTETEILEGLKNTDLMGATIFIGVSQNDQGGLVHEMGWYRRKGNGEVDGNSLPLMVAPTPEAFLEVYNKVLGHDIRVLDKKRENHVAA